MNLAWKITGEAVRYAMAGVLNTATGWLLYPIAITVLGQDHYVLILIACNFLTYLQAYLLSVFFVFNVKSITLSQYALHNGAYWFLFLVSLVTIPFCAEHFGIDPRITFIAFAASSVPLGFVWQKYIVFSYKTHQQ